VNHRSEWQRRRLRPQVLAIHGDTCWLCEERIDLTLRWPHSKSLSIDHVVPLAKGGAPYDLANLRPAHVGCNTSRGARDAQGLPTRTPAPIRRSRTW
jgi:5-methylcytosine-specific restriction endonuclease McrA